MVALAGSSTFNNLKTLQAVLEAWGASLTLESGLAVPSQMIKWPLVDHRFSWHAIFDRGAGRESDVLIKLAAGFKGEIFYNSNRSVGVERRVLDDSRMWEELVCVAPSSFE